MEKFLEKAGIYDLFAVLLAGICALTVATSVLRNVYGVTVSDEIQTSGALLFLVYSYLIGVIMQEVSSLIMRKLLFKGNKLLKKAIKTNTGANELLTHDEKEDIIKYVSHKKGCQETDLNDIYNYCHYYVIEKGHTNKMDLFQSLSGMSRGLFLYFSIWSVISCVRQFQDFTPLKCGWFFVSLALAVIFFYRTVRFAVMRYIDVFRSFYYQEREQIATWKAQNPNLTSQQA